jgi:hypothetical protein
VETGPAGHDAGGVIEDTQHAKTPTILPRLLKDPNHEKSKRVMDAMMTMKKIDIAALKNAYEGQ